MKKFIIVAALVLGFAVAASAQPKALGLHLGYGAELSYQHTISDKNFIEADLGLGDFAYLNIAGIYNYMIARPDWTNTGSWGFYAGPGIALGAGKNVFNIGVAGQAGLEYTFDFPLQLSVDIRPQLGLVSAGEVKKFGIWGWYPNLSARYVF